MPLRHYSVNGVAGAFSIVTFFILLIITLIQNRVTRATESYDLA